MSGDTEDKPQPLIEHLMELRTRLIQIRQQRQRFKQQRKRG